MADDAGVAEQVLHVTFSEAGDSLRLKSVKDLPEAFALAEDREPRQPGLKPFEYELLEEPNVVTVGTTPFVIVVLHVEGIGVRPTTSCHAVDTHEGGFRGGHRGVVYTRRRADERRRHQV
jgi:hypothetical protein